VKYLLLAATLALGWCLGSMQRQTEAVASAPATAPDDTDEDSDKYSYDAPITPYTEDALLIAHGAQGWGGEEIKVPLEPGMVAYVCFRVKDRRLLDCFYKSLDNNTDVVEQWVLPNKEIL